MKANDLDTTKVRRWRRYPKYRRAAAWFGEIPFHWAVTRLKHVFAVLNGSTPRSTEEHYWDGDILWTTPEDLGSLQGSTLWETARQITQAGYESCGTNLAPAGSLILSTRAPIGHVAIAGRPMCTNQGCRSLVFRTEANPRFFYYLLVAGRGELESWGEGSTFRELARDRLSFIPLLIPPLAEQDDITAFLDRETARIDALIEKKEQLIALLEEKRQAVISHAVTRGLDPTAPLKGSGIPCLGEVPAHWTVCALKRTWLRCDYGLSDSLAGTGEVRVLTMGNIQQGTVTIPDEGSWDDVPADMLLDENDLLFNRTNSLEHVGKVGLFRCDPSVRVSFASYLVRLKLNELAVPAYMNYFLNHDGFLRMAQSAALPSINQANLNPTRYGALLMCLPPVSEQRAIVSVLDREGERTKSLVSRIQDGIDRLEEYRTALISAAVTGQIDVRQEVPA
jgi:type I restriction enzyme S subunit